jgi:hypothetical protein
VAISSVNKIVINEWLRLNNSGFLMEVMERVVFFANCNALAVELGKMEGNGRIQFGHRVKGGRGWDPANGRPGHAPLGGLLERFPMDSCILVVRLHGSCYWATPQPRNLSLQVITTRIHLYGNSSDKKGRVKAWHFGKL